MQEQHRRGYSVGAYRGVSIQVRAQAVEEGEGGREDKVWSTEQERVLVEAEGVLVLLILICSRGRSDIILVV